MKIMFSVIALALSASVAATTFDLDVDDDGDTAALTDGLLVIRYMFGFSGEALVAQALSVNAVRIKSAEIETHLDVNQALLDVDGNGDVTALTDGLLIIRSLFGFSGDSLTANAVGSGASRGDAVALQGYLQSILDSDNDGVVDSRDGYPFISLGGRLDSDGDGYPDECDEPCIAAGLSKDLETITENDAISSVTPTSPATTPPSDTQSSMTITPSNSGTFIWNTHNWNEETWQ